MWVASHRVVGCVCSQVDSHELELGARQWESDKVRHHIPLLVPSSFRRGEAWALHADKPARLGEAEGGEHRHSERHLTRDGGGGFG